MIKYLIDDRESADDLVHGQVVVIAARWVLVVAGLLLALWDPAAMGELRVQIVLILGLAVGNFFLQTQALMRRPILVPVAYAASAGDIAAISLLIIAQGGFESNVYVFYLPALLAVSVAFRQIVTAALAGSAILSYGLISAVTFGPGDEVALFTRVLIMAAVATCGSVFWGVERKRQGDETAAGERRNAPSRETVEEDLRAAASVPLDSVPEQEAARVSTNHIPFQTSIDQSV